MQNLAGVFLVLLSSALFAMPISMQGDILRSARNADIQAYYSWSGVVIIDTPQISPFFACQRAYIYQNYTVDGTLMVDRISCQQNSYYKQAWQGIQMCNSGNILGKKYIDASLGYSVNYGCN